MSLRRKTRGELQVLQIQAENRLLCVGITPHERASAQRERMRVLTAIERLNQKLLRELGR